MAGHSNILAWYWWVAKQPATHISEKWTLLFVLQTKRTVGDCIIKWRWAVWIKGEMTNCNFRSNLTDQRGSDMMNHSTVVTSTKIIKISFFFTLSCSPNLVWLNREWICFFKGLHAHNYLSQIKIAKICIVVSWVKTLRTLKAKTTWSNNLPMICFLT